MDKCETCNFWQFSDHANDGQPAIGSCRRYAPSPIFEANEPSELNIVWPPTDADKWCGDFVEIKHKNLDPMPTGIL